MGKMPKGWLCLEKPIEDWVVQRASYGDQLGQLYSWDDRVPNCRSLQAGHLIALWDGEQMHGVSVIEHIALGKGTKVVLRCPSASCNRTDVRVRKDRLPAYRCGKCQLEFDQPTREVVEVETFTADYEAAWTPVVGIDAKQCRALAVSPVSQHSLRPLDPAKLEGLFSQLPQSQHATLIGRAAALPGGHRSIVVRARVGQGAFRARLLEQFGSNCAFTGPAHKIALQAAHLYSYAELGAHSDDGGLLMRADIHRLFDEGYITVEPSTLAIQISPEISSYAPYASLHGRHLQVKLSPTHLHWLKLHWTQHHAKRPTS